MSCRVRFYIPQSCDYFLKAETADWCSFKTSTFPLPSKITGVTSYLVEVVEDDAELAKLLDPPRHINIAVQVNGQRSLIDDGLHASDSKVVVAVVKSGVDQAFFAEAENLPTCQGTYAEEPEQIYIRTPLTAFTEIYRDMKCTHSTHIALTSGCHTARITLPN